MFDQIYFHKLEWNNFYKLLGENFFDHFPKTLIYDVFFAPKMTQFWPFSPKMTYFYQIDPINDIIYQIYVHKIVRYHFYKLLEQIFLTNFPKFWLLTSFLTQKWPNFVHFYQKWPILTKFTPLMTFSTKYMPINLTEIIFRNFLEKIFFDRLPKNFTFDVFFAPKMTQFWPFSPKMTYFDQIYPH